MAWIGPVIQAASELTNTAINKHQQDKANRYNVMLQREQQQWEKAMSDTAIQRRADDIEKAGGNRALAFVNGSEASTPSITPAHVEPVRLNNPNVGSAFQLYQNIKTQEAQRANIEADTKGKTIANNIANGTAAEMAALNMDLKTIAKQTAEKNYDILEQQLKNAVKTGENLATQGAGYALQNQMTGAQLAQFKRTTDAMVQMAIQQAREGQLDLAALENLASIGGIEASKSKGIIDSILQAVKSFAVRSRTK